MQLRSGKVVGLNAKPTKNLMCNIKQFDPIVFEHNASNPNIACIGKRATGKLILIKDLLYHMQHINTGTVISPTENNHSFYSEFIPKLCIHDDYNSFIIKTILKRQKSALNDSKKDSKAFLVLDGCLYDDKWKKDKLLFNVFMNARYYNLTTITSFQYPMYIAPQIRSNFNYIFMFNDYNIHNKNRLYQCYASMFPSFESFCHAFDQCTKNEHSCMVICNNSRSNLLEDKVFWYKAELHNDLKMCAEDYWKLSENLDVKNLN